MRVWWAVLAALILCAPASILVIAQGMAGGGASGLIWTTQGQYIGSSQCALCHSDKAGSYRGSAMHLASEPVENCAVLKANPRLTWADGDYQYVIEKTAKGYRYAVTDGTQSAETLLRFALGRGKAGQTYVYREDGELYESRVSFYDQLHGLALTIGARNSRPANVKEALGRRMSHADQADCFGCHTTAARRGSELQLDHYENGVQCEACHGPGAAHIESISDGKPKPGTIRSLKGMDAEETSELCGSCHRTWETIMLLRIRGTGNVRFQPYRLANSMCYSASDPRIACTACHDPHKALVTDIKSYDAKCVACHNASNTAIHKRTCKVGTEACASCHMPRIEAPGSHHAFADHWIRIVRPGEKYPD